MASRILLGHIAGAHGVRGEVLIKSYTGAPEDISAYGALIDESGARSFEIAVVRVTAKGVVARIEGVSDRTAAEKLKGTRFFAERAQLPATESGEYYHADLIGLAAVSLSGRAIGEVVGVQNYGAGDLLEIRLAGARKTELLPFTDAFVPTVDIAAGTVIVVFPEPDEDQDKGDGN